MLFVLIVTCWLLLVTVNSDLVCPEGWHKHDDQCYWLSDFNKTRDEAKLECEERNSSLVTIITNVTNNFLQQHIFNNTNYWIGLKIHGFSEYKWQWSTGQKVITGHYLLIKWCNGHSIGTACAAATYINAEPHICYESYNCGTKQRYVCEKEKLPMSSCPDGWDEHAFAEFSTKCYYISVSGLSNMDAARFCWSHGARLITVTYNTPNKYLRDNKPGPNEVYWIGLSPYKWDDATPYNWNNWDTDGPSIGAKCTLLQQDGTWHHAVCTDLNDFVCQKGAVMSTAVIKKTTITTFTATTSPEIPLFSSSEMPSTSSVSIISTTSQLTTVYTTYVSAIANESSHTEMLLETSTPTSHSELAMYLMIGVYTAVGVVFVVFVGLLATCLVLRKRHISRMKNMSIEQETQFSEIAPHDGDVDYIYDSPEIVQIEEATQPQNSSSVDVTKSTLSTGTGVVLNDASSSTSKNASGSNTIAQTKSSSINDTTRNGVITEYANSNGEPPQQEAADTVSSAAGLAHTSVSPRQVSINGEVYAEVDMSRKTIGYDDVILPQPATNDQCEQSKRSKILSPTCNQDANEPPDLEDTSENVYYNESAQPIYSNEDSDHDLENQYNNAVSSDTCDTDNSMNDEETYANCGDETGGVAYTEVDLSEPTSNMPTTEEEGAVYSDIKM